MKALQSGKLDRRMVIETPTFIRDAVGQQIGSYALLAVIWGESLALRFGEKPELKPGGDDKAPGPSLVATARYRVRWRSDLAVGQRVIVDSGTYTITAIEQPAPRRSVMLLTLSA